MYVCMSFIWFSQQTVIIPLYDLDWFYNQGTAGLLHGTNKFL